MNEQTFVELVLTCDDQAEAEKIADVLLQQKLIACAKFIPVDSKFRWKGEIESSHETLMLMESVADNFDRIEAVVADMHSYETFVLEQSPVTKLSSAAKLWLSAETDQK